jgi:predicted Ser/Thr protein kinase
LDEQVIKTRDESKPEKETRDRHGLIGQVIDGRFAIEGVIGEGGMGIVYLGHQTNVDRRVAIKVLLPERCDEETVRRFQNEAKAASALSHPNTITIHDFGSWGDLLYIAMEFLEGQALQDVLDRDKRMDPLRVCRITMQVLASLQEAHQVGIIHRDIKPDNVYLKVVGGQPDFVKVLDFGVAKLRDPSLIDATITQAGMIFGTPKYMSPEQAKAKKLDGRSDLYALGVVAYECLMGVVPFMAEDPVSILIQHVHDPPPPFKERRPDLDLPPELEQIVMRALEKERQDRYPSADLMREAFDGYAEKYRLGALNSGGYPTTGAPFAGGYPTPSGPLAATVVTPSGVPGAATPGRMVLAPTGPMGQAPGASATPQPAGASAFGARGTPSPVGVGALSGPAGHGAETIAAEPIPRPKQRKGRDFHDFGPAMDDAWGGELNLGEAPGTRLMRVEHGSRGLLVTLLVLGLLLLGGVGFLIYRLTDQQPSTDPSLPAEARPPESGAPSPGASTDERVAPGLGDGPSDPTALAGVAGAPADPANGPGGEPSGPGPAGPPVSGPPVVGPPVLAAVPGGAPAAAPGGDASGEGPGVIAPNRLRVQIELHPTDAQLDFGGRQVEPVAGAAGLYLIDGEEGEVLEFRASASGYRSREVSERLSAPRDDGTYEVSVRLRRERETRRDPCVDSRTGLRDPYCNER